MMLHAVTRILRAHGGVHPDERKHTSDMPIQAVPLPKHLYVPLKQHIGAPAKPEVMPGQHVSKGQLLARGQGAISAAIHAPCSGHIVEISEHPAPHPSGLPTLTVVIENDGLDESIDVSTPIHPQLLEPEDIAARVAAAGIVGLGGATFPSSVKLTLGQRKSAGTLIINGSECEPYLTCDDRLMQEQAEAVIDGIRIMAQALNVFGAPDVVIAIEANKQAAIEAMRAASRQWRRIEIVTVPTRYPMGAEKQLIHHLTGREIPAAKLTADVDALVHNVGTAFAVHQAVRHGLPLTSRIVTVAGDAVAKPGNYEVPFGMRISDLLAHCGLKEQPARLIMGGPMMGQEITNLDAPIIKGSSGILALSQAEVDARAEKPCIRCASCVDACPMGLLPLAMASQLKNGNLDAALDLGLADCISCAACSYSCPSRIPLVHYFNYGKGEMVARREAQRKDEEIKRLIEEKQQRMAKIEQERAEAAAKRKAAMAAKAAAEKAATEVKEEAA